MYLRNGQGSEMCLFERVSERRQIERGKETKEGRGGRGKLGENGRKSDKRVGRGGCQAKSKKHRVEG